MRLGRFAKGAACGLAVVTGMAATLPLGQAVAQSQPDVLSAVDEAVYRSAFGAFESNAWDTARTLAGQAQDPVLAEVITWLDLQRDPGTADFRDIADFLVGHADWPRATQLRLLAERRIPPGLPDAEIVAWHDQFPPLTFDASTAYVDALMALGRAEDARTYLRDRWIDIPLTDTQHAQWIGAYGRLLTAEDHWARLDNLLWEVREGEAAQMYPLVSAGQRALAEARLLLAQRENGVDDAIRAVPEELRADEGLMYERTRWRRRAGFYDGAREILAVQPASLTQDGRWFTERFYQAREAFYDGDYQTAYRLAADHRQTGAYEVSEMEWFAGWVALRRLGDPALARQHFEAMLAVVESPISIARGNYWIGRAEDARGNTAEADGWYERAAVHDTTFYGQLAADELGRPTVSPLPPPPQPGAAETAFEAITFVRVIRALSEIGETENIETFLRHTMGVVDSPAEVVLLGRLAAEVGYPDIGVRLAKSAQRDGVLAVDIAYPTVDLSTADPDLEPALALAIIRQESEFDADVVSFANAHGLMQIIPGTEASVARSLGLTPDTDRLTRDPAYNIRIGSTYLSRLVGDFRGSYILAIAGYNAGPGRSEEWARRFGDPRGRDLYQVIDFLETIPFNETRNYVQRVTESVAIYRQLLGETPATGQLTQVLTR